MSAKHDVTIRLYLLVDPVCHLPKGRNTRYLLVDLIYLHFQAILLTNTMEINEEYSPLAIGFELHTVVEMDVNDDDTELSDPESDQHIQNIDSAMTIVYRAVSSVSPSRSLLSPGGPSTLSMEGLHERPFFKVLHLLSFSSSPDSTINPCFVKVSSLAEIHWFPRRYWIRHFCGDAASVQDPLWRRSQP
ncbi:hypothetical protein M422DRAFT_275373 [Sphaerobolus stellatus SS14]|uniref:Uncharacterized protein n=1 Tax=Sphaerobolus stellatus (strain SS14) TaxID=990650 RepID=A0A0C9UFL1_SPHS4|nr:hypothetical protein M422DRAFT_275373 [Sphaerobolus stellatus SS14]